MPDDKQPVVEDNATEGDKQEGQKEGAKETEAPEKKEEETVNFLGHEITKTERDQLALVGYNALQDKNAQQQTDLNAAEKKEEESMSDTDKLGKSVAEMRQELDATKKELSDTKAINRLNTEITQLTQGDKFLTAHPELMKDVQEDVWRGVATQGSVPVATHFSNTVKKYERLVQNAVNAYTKSKLETATSTEGGRGSGSGVALPEGGKATAEDIKSGAARRHLMEALAKEQ